MITSDIPTSPAILSNVGAVSEFTIKATSRSFSILSSGLYANKVRAIIRELSCNALDSHVANGNVDVPFVVHLPNSMEPFFSVRDFGTGLDNDQVTSIFTSFFTSTKTGSNDFIGALGLGSKSPFSYTDNFTVVAVKDGVKGIYTAFINETGVPSIALMMSEETNEPSGVEIKFAVNERYDFGKFRDEARQVFKYWKNRPTITGNADFAFVDPIYKDQNIVPGVHSLDNSYHSYAVMGNIAYPIEIPDADTSLEKLRPLLGCGLVMEFAIGELDFQASREGLSYVPLTINSIKKKLETLNSQLAIHIANEAVKIDNMWDRASYLYSRMNETLWSAAVAKYVTDSKFPLLNVSGNRWNALVPFEFKVSDLAATYNISIRSFTKSRGQNTCANNKPEVGHDKVKQVAFSQWSIRPEADRYFVFNDSKVGATERAKHHWRNRAQTAYTEIVYVLEPVDKTKPMKRTEFLNAIMNPPDSQIMEVSSLLAKEREAGMGKNVTIMCLEKRSRGYWGDTNMVWADAGKADSFDANTTYYYLPLSGYSSLGITNDVKTLQDNLFKSGVFTGTVYGVRKGDMEYIETQKNWINLDTMVKEKLAKLDASNIMSVVKEEIGFSSVIHWDLSSKIDANSPYAQLASAFKDVKSADATVIGCLRYLCNLYKVSTANIDPTALITKYKKQISDIQARYPLLSNISRYNATSAEVAEYINMVDYVATIKAKQKKS